MQLGGWSGRSQMTCVNSPDPLLIGGGAGSKSWTTHMHCWDMWLFAVYFHIWLLGDVVYPNGQQ